MSKLENEVNQWMKERYKDMNVNEYQEKAVGKKSLPDDWQQQLASEIGDVLWYCAALARDLDMSLATIMAANLDKLKTRQEQGTLGGSGDKR